MSATMRSGATWIGIAAICLVILFVPIFYGAQRAVEENGSDSGFWLTGPLPGAAQFCNDFESRAAAQRVFMRLPGNADVRRWLDGDGDGRVCEIFDYRRAGH